MSILRYAQFIERGPNFRPQGSALDSINLFRVFHASKLVTRTFQSAEYCAEKSASLSSVELWLIKSDGQNSWNLISVVSTVSNSGERVIKVGLPGYKLHHRSVLSLGLESILVEHRPCWDPVGDASSTLIPTILSITEPFKGYPLYCLFSTSQKQLTKTTLRKRVKWVARQS